MRTNKYGIRGLKSVKLKKELFYFWVPPVSLQKAGIFRYATLGPNFNVAAAKARKWNAKLDAHRGAVNARGGHWAQSTQRRSSTFCGNLKPLQDSPDTHFGPARIIPGFIVP